MGGTTTRRMLALTADRVPFVHAVVVRAQVPTSAKAGDDAIVLGDGSIEGFVGGQCAEASVRTAALDVLSRGEPRLLRVLPDGEQPFPESDGAQVVVNTCLSGGALEIFLEPMLPAPVVAVIGTSPVAEALVTIGEVLGYAMDRTGAVDAGASAVVVASHGVDELRVLREAIDADVPYIALVASRRRGAAVLDELGLTGAERERVRTPAGLDIGARSGPEVALSILAEVVPVARAAGDRGVRPSAVAPRQAVDPVCGMSVTVVAGTPHLSVDGADVWFCSEHCRDHHAAGLSA